MVKGPTPLLSVIIPVFNSQPYIVKCIESVLNQTYKSLEIVLIDDGSSDGSEEIIDELAVNYKNILVIHQNNQGPQAARFEGVRRASGKYVSFVDSDDWIEPEMFEQLISEIGDADLITSGLFIHDSNEIILDILTDGYESGVYYTDDEYIVHNMMIMHGNNMQTIGGIINSSCCKVFIKEKLVQIEKLLDKRIKNEEDFLLCLFYLLNVSVS